MRQRRVGEQALVLYLIDHVNAIGEQLLLDALELIAQHQRLEAATQAGSQLAALGQQFEADVGDAALVILAIDYQIILVFHFFFSCQFSVP